MIHCLHGNVGSPEAWDLFKDQLDDEIRPVELWPLLASGPRSLSEAGQTIARSAGQGDVLLGYSLGGRLALHALLADPKKWKAAIIVSAHPGLERGHRERLQQDEEWACLIESDWDGFLRRWNSLEILQGKRLPSSCFPQATIARQAMIAQGFRSWSLGAQDNLLPAISKLPCPILWITGALDHKYDALADQLATKLRHVRHLSVPDSGHRIPWENPEVFSEHIRRFLTSLKSLP
ncbi:alpha/beta fold hydrolase [Verrucomicrobiaceae bacterium 227]